MEYTTFKDEWRITPPDEQLLANVLRASNETNRLLAAVGTLLEQLVPKPPQYEQVINPDGSRSIARMG